MKKLHLILLGLFVISLFGGWVGEPLGIISIFSNLNLYDEASRMFLALCILYFVVMLISAFTKNYVFSLLSLLLNPIAFIFLFIIVVFIATPWNGDMLRVRDLTKVGFGPFLAGFSLIALQFVVTKSLLSELRIKKKK